MTYDFRHIIEQPHLLRAGPLKLAAYRVKDVEADKMSSLQFHMTYDNTVMAVMDESSAKLFCKFVQDTLHPMPAPDTKV